MWRSETPLNNQSLAVRLPRTRAVVPSSFRPFRHLALNDVSADSIAMTVAVSQLKHDSSGSYDLE